MRILIIFLILLIATPAYANYVKFNESPYAYFPTYDDRYLRLGFENADFVPTETGFYRVSDTETRLYVDGSLIHTWYVTAAINYLLLDDGVSKILLDDGTSFLLLAP